MDFISAAPWPPKGLNTEICAVLQEDRYNASGKPLICQGKGGERVQSVPCSAIQLTLLYMYYGRGQWEADHKTQSLCYPPKN